MKKDLSFDKLTDSFLSARPDNATSYPEINVSFGRKIRFLAAGAVLCGALAVPLSGQEASQATIQANQALLDELPFEDERDFENAQRGFIATLDADVIPGPEEVVGPDGVAYDLRAYDFLEGTALK